MKTAEIFKQYIWLADIINRMKRLTLNEINERWMQTDMSGGLPMSRTTFNRHRLAIEEMFDLCIGCKESGRKSYYYIENIDVLENDNLKHWMLDALSIGKLLMDNISLKDRIVLEKIPAGKHFLNPIIGAMKQNRKLLLTYRKFGQEEPYTITVEPYAIKVFKQRWYLLAKNYKREAPSVYALDRMEALVETDEHFDLPAGFSARDFFGDCYGVIHDDKRRPQHIVIRAYDRLAHYLRTLPLHHSQSEVATKPTYTDFSYHLCPTFDFMQELLAQGKDVEVLRPASFRREMMELLREAMGRYGE